MLKLCTHTLTCFHVCVHTCTQHTHTSISPNHILYPGFTILILSLHWVVVVLVAKFLFLFFPDCYQTVHSIISISLIFIIVLQVLNPTSVSQKSNCVYPTLIASEIWLIQFSVWNDVSHLSTDTIAMQHFQNYFS